MCTGILEQSISAETRRAIFLNDRLSEGHQLEQLIDGVWLVTADVDTVDVMVNPNDYRVKLRSIAASVAASVALAAVEQPALKAVQDPTPSLDQIRTNKLIDRLRKTVGCNGVRRPSYVGA